MRIQCLSSTYSQKVVTRPGRYNLKARPRDLVITYSQASLTSPEYRYLFVKHILTPKEKKILQRITRGFTQLRTLRSIMDEVYRLFDRRCRMDTALTKLAVLRRRVHRFKKFQKSSQKAILAKYREISYLP